MRVLLRVDEGLYRYLCLATRRRKGGRTVSIPQLNRVSQMRTRKLSYLRQLPNKYKYSIPNGPDTK